MAGVTAIPAFHVTLAGRAIPVRVRRNANARRLILRLDGRSGDIIVTLPPKVSEALAHDLIRDKAPWLTARLACSPIYVPFAPGAEIPILGNPHIIRHLPDARGGVWQEAGGLHVSGGLDHLPRRVTDWLRKIARAEIARRIGPFAAQLKVRPGRLSIRDTRTRWGSCAANGNLSFSWRLVMAPEPVLSYVVAHEVAHLLEHNHSPRFWAAVQRLMPDMQDHRDWLKRHGRDLHLYG
ncbi:MAG: M48 family metallopeptidase [Magnetospiraceae bacterium]